MAHLTQWWGGQAKERKGKEKPPLRAAPRPSTYSVMVRRSRGPFGVPSFPLWGCECPSSLSSTISSLPSCVICGWFPDTIVLQPSSCPLCAWAVGPSFSSLLPLWGCASSIFTPLLPLWGSSFSPWEFPQWVFYLAPSPAESDLVCLPRPS